jgi:hypothetical protein
MAKKKEIEFLTIKEIIDTIHMGNKDNFLVDFKSWLEIVINTTHSVRMAIDLGGTEEQKKEYKSVKNSDLVGCNSMKWIDDGKHNISIKINTK